MAAVVLGSLHIPLDTTQAVFATGIGAVTFPVMLGLNQVGLKTLSISSRSPLLVTSAAGGLSVALASLVASTAVIKSCAIFRIESETRMEFKIKDLLVSAASGVIMFRALGGRYSSMVPSHLHVPGCFARHWIPAYSIEYANVTQKNLIQEIGRKYGCHSCGTKRIKQYYADHQPPNKLIKASLGPLGKTVEQNGRHLQRFYPQCPSCSLRQGHSLAVDSKTSAIIIHSMTFSPYHIFLPTPIAVLLLKYYLLESQTVDMNNTVPEESDREVITQKEKDPIIEDGIKQMKHNKVSNNFSGLVTNFPLFIVWQKIVSFIDSFSPVGSFHMTLWGFTIIAALGTL